MTTPVLPSLVGLSFPIKRSVIWNNQINTAVSGKETAIAYWSEPRFAYELSFELLRCDATNHEFQTFLAMLLQLKNTQLPFLYTDPEDSVAVAQSVGTGDGSTKDFQLKRVLSFGGFSSGAQTILAPNTGATKTAYVNGTPTAVTWNDYDSAKPGQITFAAAPAAAAAITADFSYYWPCRCPQAQNQIQFSKEMSTYYNLQGFKFMTLKQ